MSLRQATAAVDAIGRMNISGNVVPQVWWKNILLPSGKPDCKAIMLLSEIIYWYRPTEVRDEVTGDIIQYTRKFHADKLQRSYQAFADAFGFSKREATDALKRLKKAGLITIELRDVKTEFGMLANVVFVEPVATEIERVSIIPSTLFTADTQSCQRNSSYVETEHPSHPDGEIPTAEEGTNTEITTEINSNYPPSENSGEISDDVPSDVEKFFLSRHPEAIDGVYSPSGKLWGTENDLTAARYAYSRVLATVNPSLTEPSWARWANDIRLLRDTRNVTHRQICEVFRWANEHHFWGAQTQSPSGLRKHWDTLVAQMCQGKQTSTSGTDLDWDNTDWADGVLG